MTNGLSAAQVGLSFVVGISLSTFMETGGVDNYANYHYHLHSLYVCQVWFTGWPGLIRLLA